MKKVLISMPDELHHKMKVNIPTRQRSKVIVSLLEEEIKRREKRLYQCALEVEKDQELSADMQDWDLTINDGLNDESW